MKGIRAIKLVGEQYLGSTVEIQAVFDEAPDSVVLRLKDPYDTIVLDSVSMIGDSGGLYYYYDYQQIDTNNYGEYRLIIKAVYSGNPIYAEYIFSMYDADPNVIGGF